MPCVAQNTEGFGRPVVVDPDRTIRYLRPAHCGARGRDLTAARFDAWRTPPGEGGLVRFTRDPTAKVMEVPVSTYQIHASGVRKFTVTGLASPTAALPPPDWGRVARDSGSSNNRNRHPTPSVNTTRQGRSYFHKSRFLDRGGKWTDPMCH
jgi:hypothetical protein